MLRLVGTGLRVSVMLHMPALVITRQIEKVFRSLQKINLAVRGLYGEGSQAMGDFYQISNQITLGKSERELLEQVNEVVPVLIDYERRAREFLVRESQMDLRDDISRKERERISRRFVDQIHDIIGPDTDIPAPDMGTGYQEMAWIRNQWEKYHGFNPACITGKPVEQYGAEGREEATGRGVGIMSVKLLKRLGRKPQETRVAIQGFGNVGSHAAKFLSEADFRIVAISDHAGGFYLPAGLDIPKALRYAMHNNGSLVGFSGGEPITNESLLALDVDVLIPAAIGGVITRENVAEIRAPVIIEAANAPIHPDADDVLDERQVLVLPDILANAGGVTVSYFEWVQNRQHYKWNLNRVRQELDHVLSEAFENVWQFGNERQISLRTAAYMIAIQRVWRATQLAGY